MCKSTGYQTLQNPLLTLQARTYKVLVTVGETVVPLVLGEFALFLLQLSDSISLTARQTLARPTFG